MPNRLAQESSPYLRQHAGNPVDWYPWSAEALDRAKREDKPILLSIGYAACHWCHVMEHESFEDPGIAALMNEHFINIKVDREERPDLDAIYMQAVQALTGRGGWPMTVFLTPGGRPFYGGTYYPPTDRHGMPGFPRVLTAIASAYANDRATVETTTRQLQQIYDAAALAPSPTELTRETLLRTARRATEGYDSVYGGFRGAPKFPPSMVLQFLLTQWARHQDESLLAVVKHTFLAMARGGIFDQIGGGLHRYSVDERWLVPHFEKMLYDNALFLSVAVSLYQITRDDEVRRAAVATIRWLEREMTDASGGFYASLDADSEGHEGTYYVWDADAIARTLGDDAPLAQMAWGITKSGNFEGKNILFRAVDTATLAHGTGLSIEQTQERLDRCAQMLLALRAERPRPARDEKLIASWNGLMLQALCDAALVFPESNAATLAQANGAFLLSTLCRDGRVARHCTAGRVASFGFLEDYAAIGLGFTSLFSLTGAVHWLHAAQGIADTMVERFYDTPSGLFFDVARDHEQLIARPRDTTDNAIPSGTSLAADLLARLAVLLDRADFEELATQVVRGAGSAATKYPHAFGYLLCVSDTLTCGAVEVAIVGDNIRALHEAAGTTYAPGKVIARGECALTRGRADEGPGRAFVCRRYACDAPTDDPTVLRRQVAEAGRAS